MARARAVRTVESSQPLESLRQSALETQDALLISDLIRRIGESESPSESRAEALDLIAKAHPEKTNVVIGCISALHRLNSPLVLPLCRTIINAPTNPDRDFIVAFAVETLVSLPSPERVDMLLLAKAVDSRLPRVQNTARRALAQLPALHVRSFIELTATDTDRPSVVLLRRLLNEASLTSLALPARPVDSPVSEVGERKASAKREAGTVRQPRPTRSQDTASAKSYRQAEPSPGARDAFTDLHKHRLAELASASNSTLAKLIESPNNYREQAAALVEYTVRNGSHAARRFNGKLVYALSDASNPERARFTDIALVWHRSV